MLAVECESKAPNTIDISKESEGIRMSTQALQPGCECYCCKNYTKGYLFHLFEVREMNANVLLAIHNSYVFDQLFVQLSEVDKQR